MAIGRCSGCGRTGQPKKLYPHVLECPDYLALFREDPARCLDPESEQARYRAADTAESRAEKRSERLSVRFAEIDEVYQRQITRWAKPPDILAD